jgi:hypothetical protein
MIYVAVVDIDMAEDELFAKFQEVKENDKGYCCLVALYVT